MSSISSRSARSRKPLIRKHQTSPSMTSLFSTLTTSSSGSNSTITQESFNQPRQRSSKQSTTRKGSSARQASRKASSRMSPSVSPIAEKPNVFAFMETDEEENVTNHSEAGAVPYTSITDEHPDTPTTSFEAESSPAMSFNSLSHGSQYSQEHPHQWNGDMVRASSNSFHSDSGISVRSSSPEHDSPVLRQNGRADRVGRISRGSIQKTPAEDTPDPNVSPTSTQLPFPPFRISDHIDENLNSSPEAYYSTSSRPIRQYPDPHAASGYSRPSRTPASSLTHRPPSVPRRDKQTEGPKDSGYDFLASKISVSNDAVLKPIYRKFETLNNRLLLYLQDEISELEEDLARLDAAIAKEQKALGVKAASRRTEARMPSLLQWQRMELMGRAFAKVEQYNHAVSSYSNLTKSLEPTSPTVIDAYKDWITNHEPVVELETSFLHHHADLGTITQQSPNRVQASEASLMAPGFTLLSTIIAFKLVPFFLARLIVATTALGMVYAFSPAALLNSTTPGNYRRDFAIHLAAVVILALAID